MANKTIKQLTATTTAPGTYLFAVHDNVGSTYKITKANLQAALDHDALTNFEADEHVAHTSVSIIAGSGLTGGGNISASRTLNVGAGTGISVAADAISVDETSVNHDNLSNFVANKHIDHTAVTLTAGNGLTGGGDISASRSFHVGAGTGVTVAADAVSIGQDVAVTANVTFSGATINGTLSTDSLDFLDDASPNISFRRSDGTAAVSPDFDFPDTTTGDVNVRFFRNTNTSGNRQVNFYAGDGTANATVTLDCSSGDATFDGTLNIAKGLLLTSGGGFTISSGVITVSQDNFFIAVDTESAAATDDLDTISGGVSGQLLILRSTNSARDVTVKDATGNLRLGVGDFGLTSTQDRIILFSDGTNWYELSRSNNA